MKMIVLRLLLVLQGNTVLWRFPTVHHCLLCDVSCCAVLCDVMPQVDCTAEMDMCREHFITGFPSIRVFRRAHDDIYIGVSEACRSAATWLLSVVLCVLGGTRRSCKVFSPSAAVAANLWRHSCRCRLRHDHHH
jgi:hypothetical protein